MYLINLRGDLTMENERTNNAQGLYGSTMRKDQNSMYERQLDVNGAVLGMGMQEMAQMAASAGNSLNLTRGVHNLEASNRKPLQQRNSQYDMLSPSNFEGVDGR